MAMEEVQTLNMRAVTINKVIRKIRYQLEDEDYEPIVIIGKAGIGKTMSIAKLAKEMGIGFIEIRLGNYQESDLIGLPYRNENNQTSHAITDMFPPSDDPGQGIILLDEVTSAPRPMRTAVYQLMDSSRKLGKYSLPKKWLIVACGNGPDDGGDFRGIEAAFLSRSFCWRLEPNVNTWKQWALQNDVHPTVIAYLSFMPEKIYCMDLDNPYSVPACPRNWVKLSIQLFNMEKRYPGHIIDNDDDLQDYAAGCIGVAESAHFTAFYRYNKETINPQDIIDGKIKPERMLNVKDEVLYITAQNLVHLISEDIKQHKGGNNDAGVTDDCLKRVGNLLSWCVNLPKAGVRIDVAITIITDLCASVGPDIQSIIVSEAIDEACPDLAEFCEENAIVINNF